MDTLEGQNFDLDGFIAELRRATLENQQQFDWEKDGISDYPEMSRICVFVIAKALKNNPTATDEIKSAVDDFWQQSIGTNMEVAIGGEDILKGQLESWHTSERKNRFWQKVMAVVVSDKEEPPSSLSEDLRALLDAVLKQGSIESLRHLSKPDVMRIYEYLRYLDGCLEERCEVIKRYGESETLTVQSEHRTEYVKLLKQRIFMLGILGQLRSFLKGEGMNARDDLLATVLNIIVKINEL